MRNFQVQMDAAKEDTKREIAAATAAAAAAAPEAVAAARKEASLAKEEVQKEISALQEKRQRLATEATQAAVETVYESSSGPQATGLGERAPHSGPQATGRASVTRTAIAQSFREASARFGMPFLAALTCIARPFREEWAEYPGPGRGV